MMVISNININRIKKANIESYYNKNKKKFFLIQSNIIFILIYIINISFLKKYKIISNKCIGKFINIIPRTNLKNINRRQLKYIFKSRKLYINDANLTNEYIRCLRPLSKLLKYNINNIKKNFMKEKFNESYIIKRKDQFSFEEYAKLCINEKLINETEIKKFKKPDLPLISVIIAAYNKEKVLLKSIRSIQNQSLKNIEIIIVNDGSTDNSEKIFDYLLKSDPRIRVFRHLRNLGVWRTRIDGLLYSNSKYVIYFDCGDLYYDNYVLEDLYNLIEYYKIDSVKSVFKEIRTYDYNKFKFSKNSFKNMTLYKFFFKGEIDINNQKKILGGWWGVIWNRLILSDIYIKGLYLLSDRVLNIYKNLWEDRWWSKLADIKSNSLLIVKRYGHLYFFNGKGEGSIKLKLANEKDKMIKEFINFLYFDFDILPKQNNKTSIIKTLYFYDKINKRIKLSYLKTNFNILDDLLKKLINDPYVNIKDKVYLNQLLNNSLKRQNKTNYNLH